jgi:poly-gamma-glutamate synthesis protein (capsule biosynthesis protein)
MESAVSSARRSLSKDGIRASFLPTLIDTRLRPDILQAGDPRFDDMVRYMEWASEGFTHHFAVDGDDVAISG